MANEERFQSDLDLAPGTRLPSLTHGSGRGISLPDPYTTPRVRAANPSGSRSTLHPLLHAAISHFWR